MAAWDTVTQRRAMLGWGNCTMLPEANGGFDGIDAQLFLGLPGQYEIENSELPPEPEPETQAARIGPLRRLGLGPSG